MADIEMEEHTCKECGKSYNKKWRLEEHIRSHTGERPYKCTFEGCGKSFIRPYHLKRHSVIHTGQLASFKCSYPGCTQTFSQKHNLKRHEQRSHNHPFKCGYEGCNKSFKKSSQLRKHICLHTNESLFKCQVEECGRGFDTSSKLRRHMKVHNKGYMCSVPGCSEAFNKFSKLAVHVRSHGYVCEHCDKTFSEIWALKAHARIHSSNRKMYECPREGCSRVYTKAFNLRVHIKAFHDGNRPYLCTVEGCGKGFAHKVSLRQHLVLHSQNKVKPRLPPGDKSTQKKKSKKKRKPVSLAKQLSGYRSSLSESSDTHSMETVPKRRKTPSDVQGKATENAAVSAVNADKVHDRIAPQSDHRRSRDTVESTNPMPSINETNTVMISSVEGPVTTANNVDLSSKGLHVDSSVPSLSSEQLSSSYTRAASTASINRSEGLQDGISSGLSSNVASSSNGSVAATKTRSERIQGGLSLAPLSHVMSANKGAETGTSKNTSEEMHVGNTSASLPSVMSSAMTANINTAPSTSVPEEQNAEGVVNDLMFSSSDEEAESMDWEPADGTFPVAINYDSENECEKMGNFASKSPDLSANEGGSNDTQLELDRTGSSRKTLSKETSSGMLVAADPKESTEVSGSCQSNSCVSSLPESNGKKGQQTKKKRSKGKKKSRGCEVANASSRAVKRSLATQIDSLISRLNTSDNSGSGNEEEVSVFKRTDFLDMDDVLQVIMEEENEENNQSEFNFENEDVNLEEEYVRASSPAHSPCSKQSHSEKHSTSSANRVIRFETQVSETKEQVTSCSKRPVTSGGKRMYMTNSEEDVISPANHVLISPNKEITPEEANEDRHRSRPACDPLDGETGSFSVKEVVLEDDSASDVANDYDEKGSDEEGMDVLEQPAHDNSTPVAQASCDDETRKKDCSGGSTRDTNKDENSRGNGQVTRDENSHKASASLLSTDMEDSQASERATKNKESGNSILSNAELKRTQTNKRSSQKNERNVRTKSSLNKRGSPTPVQPAVQNTAKTRGKTPKRTTGVKGGNFVLNDLGSASSKPEKKDIEVAEPETDVSKAKFRSRGNIFTCDLQTLELLWNFKGK